MSFVLCNFLIASSIAGSPPDGGRRPLERGEDYRSVVAGNTAFAFDLYQRLATRDGNLFFSPYSVSTALAMTYAGARGKTAEEMAGVLHLPADAANVHAKFGALIATTNGRRAQPDKRRAPQFQMIAANALWLQEGFSPLQEYLSLTRRHYEAGAQSVDFSGSPENARRTINAWVAGKTRNRVPELFDSNSSPSGPLVLTNAVYFRADWEKEFRQDRTRLETFHSPTGDVRTSLMHDVRDAGYMETEHFQAIRLPYMGGPELIAFLPRPRVALADFERELSSETILAAIKKSKEHTVTLTLPKFTLSDEFDLAGRLAEMGMPSAFDSQSADFSGIASDGPIAISKVIHKTFVGVDEAKTEAAAATGVTFFPMAAANERPVFKPVAIFRADRPFIFVVRDRRTESILFIGRIVIPKADEKSPQ